MGLPMGWGWGPVAPLPRPALYRLRESVPRGILLAALGLVRRCCSWLASGLATREDALEDACWNCLGMGWGQVKA